MTTQGVPANTEEPCRARPASRIETARKASRTGEPARPAADGKPFGATSPVVVHVLAFGGITLGGGSAVMVRGQAQGPRFGPYRSHRPRGSVARIRDSWGSLYDRRVNTEAEATLTDRLGVKLGYVLRNHTLPGFAFGSDHRLVAGTTHPILQRAVSVDGTTRYERHVGRPDIADFNRYRQQFDVERLRVRVSPWPHQSLAFQREGFIRSRSRLGFCWRFASGHSLKSTYQFESIEGGRAWRPRHAIYTEWSYDLDSRGKPSQ